MALCACVPGARGAKLRGTSLAVDCSILQILDLFLLSRQVTFSEEGPPKFAKKVGKVFVHPKENDSMTE